MPMVPGPPGAPAPGRQFPQAHRAVENPRVTLTLQLVQGAAVIATRDLPLTTRDAATGSFTLDSTEADSITNYTDLRYRLIATGADGAAVEVEWLSLDIPAAPAGAVTQTINPAGVASEERDGAATVTPGDVTISPAGVPSGELSGAPSLGLRVAPAGVGSGEQGAPATLSLRVSPAGVPGGEGAGTAALSLSISPAGVPSGEQAGATAVAQQVAPAGIPSGERSGTGTLALSVSPAGIPSGESATGVQVGLSITPAGVPSGELTIGVSLSLVVSPAGVPSGAQTGAATITPGPVTISPAGVGSAGSIGGIIVSGATTQTLNPAGIGGITEGIAGITITQTPMPTVSGCLSRWGESRWGDYRWGEVGDLILIVQGSVTPTGALVKTPNLVRGGEVTPVGTLTLPPEWTPSLPPSRLGGYPVGTRLRGTGARTVTEQVPTRTKEV